MNTIWKYRIEVEKTGSLNVLLPIDAKVIFVACREPHIMSFWVELDPDRIRVLRKFNVYGTGHLIPEDLNGYSYHHCGSCLDGEFVWHLYEWRN